MPTWRGYIHTKEEFLNSEYYQQWQRLIKNKELSDMLSQNGFTMIFYPHYEVQKFIDCFESNVDCVKIGSFEKFDVQTLLKESMLLVTDYSSVFFDFAYMRKPMIYFQFDADTFFKKHYQRGYFDPKTDGFGRVCMNCEEVVKEIRNCFENDFAIEQSYLKRLESFFPLHDRNNCQRIYDQIISK